MDDKIVGLYAAGPPSVRVVAAGLAK